MSSASLSSLELSIFPTMRMPRLKSSFCGCGLEAGSKAVALLHVTLVSGLFAFGFVRQCVMEYQVYVLQQQYVNGTEETYFIEDFRNSLLRDQFAITLVFTKLIFSILLYIGVSRRDKTLIFPWIFMKSLIFLITIIRFFELSYQRVSSKYKSLEIFVCLTVLSVDAYQIALVNSFRNEIESRERNQ